MKLIKADYIFLGSLLLLITAHVTTNFLIKYYEDAAVAVGIAKEVAIQYEANPVAKWEQFRLRNFRFCLDSHQALSIEMLERTDTFITK